MNSQAQMNLVPNGSFEEYSACPEGLNQVDSCLGWHHYGGIPYLEGTPDYFDSCTTAYTNAVPDNILGSQIPFEGSAYMGIITFDWSYWYREYIGTHLTDTLVPGNNYAVSMRVSRGDARPVYLIYTCVAANNMGIRLTTFPYSQAGESIPENGFAQLHEDSIITDTTNWVLLHWNFIADSAYSYIYIGNFFESNSTDTARIACPITYGLQAYYYIDSVNVICIDAHCTTGIKSIDDQLLSLKYNENSKEIECICEKTATLLLLNLAGQTLWHGDISGTKFLKVSPLTQGIYIVELKTEQKKLVRKILVY